MGKPALPTTESESKVTRLEGMMSRLECKMQEPIVQNTTVVRSYAEVGGKEVNTSGQGNSQDEMRILSMHRQTVKTLDEYADRDRRKAIILIHNLPESTNDNLLDRNVDDIKIIGELIERGTGVGDVKVTKLIRLGGRGQNQQSKPHLILATLDRPDRRGVVLNAQAHR